ncbi:MAG: hypothetical protein KDI36_00485 [Pseudomonadales bacterium]|nr:hypothetical protein [Pseudomonadales bacterium]
MKSIHLMLSVRTLVKKAKLALTIGLIVKSSILSGMDSLVAECEANVSRMPDAGGPVNVVVVIDNTLKRGRLKFGGHTVNVSGVALEGDTYTASVQEPTIENERVTTRRLFRLDTRQKQLFYFDETWLVTARDCVIAPAQHSGH